MIKKYCYLVLLFFITSLGGNSIYSQDFKQIDEYIDEIHHLNSEETTIYILFSKNDCENCILYLHSTLDLIEKKVVLAENIKINVITDNIAYAKKYLNNYKLQYNFIFDKDIFHNFGVASRTILYLRDNAELITDPTKINLHLSKIKIDKKVVFSIKDSIFSDTSPIIASILEENIIALDNNMDIALLLLKKDSTYTPIFLNSHIVDSLKLYNLPLRDKKELKDFTLINFKDAKPIYKNFNMDMLKIQSFSSKENMVFCRFRIKRMYQIGESLDNIHMISDDFIAVKKIKDKKNISTLLDIDQYDTYYLTNSFFFNDNEFLLSNWVYSSLNILDENTIITNIDVLNSENKNEFGGLATLKLDPLNQKVKMVDLATNVTKGEYFNTEIFLNSKKYTLQKKWIDETINFGKLELIEK
ncbi:hypothetical protein [Myroides sp. DW712]|uniref:hypothetical protein n=1 Tax=Myroides sp. DW712 TaxID=3389800 RepID=UPI00397AB086